jgi:hypothetical protein
MLTQRQDTARARTEKHFGAEPSLKVGLNTEKTSSSPSATSAMAIANVPHNGISTICWKTVSLDHGAFVRAVPVQIPFEKTTRPSKLCDVQLL